MYIWNLQVHHCLYLKARVCSMHIPNSHMSLKAFDITLKFDRFNVRKMRTLPISKVVECYVRWSVHLFFRRFFAVRCVPVWSSCEYWKMINFITIWFFFFSEKCWDNFYLPLTITPNTESKFKNGTSILRNNKKKKIILT